VILRLLIIGIICFSGLASASSFVTPHLNIINHDVLPSLICTVGSRTPGESVVNLTIEGSGDPRPVQVVLSIDSSFSMGRHDRNNTRLDAARSFVGVMDSSSDRVGLVVWNSEADIMMPLTNDFALVNETINRITPLGPTDLYYGLQPAIDMLKNESDDLQKHIVLLTDGTTDAINPEDYLPEVYRAKEAGIQIWTIGFPVDEQGEIVLKNIKNITGGEYHPADKATVEDVFIKIYRNMTRLAGEYVTVEYHAPSDLTYSINHDRIEGDNKVFTWKPLVYDSSGPRNYFYIGEQNSTTFKVSSENPGLFTLGNLGSKMIYTTQNKAGIDVQIEEPIEYRPLRVIDCSEDLDYNKIKTRDIYIRNSYNISGTNINVGSGSIENDIEGEDINFGSRSFCNNCTPTDSDGEPCEKMVCVCLDPECAEVVADNGSNVNNINIVQTTIFGSTPFWNRTGETIGVINLTVSRPEAAIDAVFAFDVSGSMRLPYEGMGEVDWAAFAEANYSNVSIIGWDEEDGEGADLLIVPPRPLRGSEEEILAVLANLSGMCGETDQTVYAAGLRGVLEVDDDFGDHFTGDGKIVLFITGPDEFRPGESLDDLGTELKLRGYAIYTVGVEIDEIESPLKYDNLSRMASITGGQFYPIGDLDSDELKEVLRSVKAHASSRAAPKDVVVTETLPAHLEVKETVPSGAEVDVAKNLDGTSTLTWIAGGVRPGESRTLIIRTNVKDALPPDEVGTVAATEGIDIRPTGGDAAGVNVINMRTENGDVKIGEIS